MITRIRLVLLLLRPPVAILLALFGSIALARVHADGRFVPTLLTAIVVAGYLIFSVAVNDLADAEIDRVNLAGDPRRPLVAGAGPRRDLAVTGVVAALLAIGVSAAVGLPLLAVTLAGLGLSAAYSLRPLRLCERGALAVLMLPACYVAVPYLAAVFAARATPTGGDLFLLGGLYTGFLGRIVLKDFRDVRGDALFGKRTFLLRHGRRATCLVSAAGWTAGSALLVAGARTSAVTFDATAAAGTIATLALLRRLAVESDLRAEQRTISALAILGRGTMISLLLQLEAGERGWGVLAVSSALAGLALVTAGQAVTMLRCGPRGRTVPGVVAAPTETEGVHGTTAAALSGLH